MTVKTNLATKSFYAEKYQQKPSKRLKLPLLVTKNMLDLDKNVNNWHLFFV